MNSGHSSSEELSIEEVDILSNGARAVSPTFQNESITSSSPMIQKTGERFDPATLPLSSGSVFMANLSNMWAHITEVNTRPKWFSFISPQGKEYLQSIMKAKREQQALAAANNNSADTPNLVAALYKFDVQNNSLAENYILNPFWNFITSRIFPEWLAPNAITLSGFFCVALVFTISVINYYSYVVPSVATSQAFYNFTLLVISLLIFCYNTLDGCDGKQARRTGSSSPLGEIFDHGVDALSLTILPLSFLIVLGEKPYRAASSEFGYFVGDAIVPVLHIVMMFAFYTAHWEHYHTGRFYMGFVSASDGQFAVIGGHLAAFIYNLILPSNSVVGMGNLPFLGTNIGFWVILLTMLSSAMSPIASIYHVFNFYKQKSRIFSLDEDSTNEPIDLESGLQNREFKDTQRNNIVKVKQEIGTATMDLGVLIVMAVLYMCMSLIARVIPSEVLGDRSFYQTHWIGIMVVGGFAFGIFLTTMNIARVSNQPYPRFTKQYVVIVLPMVIFILNGLTVIMTRTGVPLINPTAILAVSIIWSALAYSFFAVSVVRELCTNLGIYAFSLAKRSMGVVVPPLSPNSIISSPTNSAEETSPVRRSSPSREQIV